MIADLEMMMGAEVRGVMDRVWGGRRRLGYREWCEENVIIQPGENSAYAGPYSSRLTPSMARLWEKFLQDDDGRAWDELALVKSSQASASFHAVMGMGWRADYNPTNMIYAIYADGEARNIADRFRWVLEGAPGLSEMLVREGVSEDDLAGLTVRMPGSKVWFTGVGSVGKTSSKPGVGLVIFDEVEKVRLPKAEASVVDLLRQRGKVTVGGKFAYFSSPTFDTGPIWKEVLTGSGHKDHVPCPHCGFFQVLRMDGVKYHHLRDKFGDLDLAKVRAEAHYECSGCGRAILESDKAEMLWNGEWRPTNFEAKEDPVTGQKEQVQAWVPRKMSAYHSDLYALWEGSRWGDLAVEKIGASRDPLKLQNFVNGRLGEAFKMGSMRRVELHHVLGLRRKDYKRGQCPFKPALVTAQFDTQDSAWKGIVSAWDEKGNQWVSDYGIFISWRDVVAFAKKGVEFGGEQFMAKFCLVDEGGHRTREVRRLCLPMTPIFNPSKGLGGVQVRRTLDWKDFEVDKGGSETVKVLTYDDDGFRRLLYRVQILDAGKDVDAPSLHLPADMDEQFCAELCHEYLVKKAGKWSYETDGANDFGDCVKMGNIAWAACGHLV